MARRGGRRRCPRRSRERYDRARAAFELRGGFEREARVARMLDGLGFDAERREPPLSTLRGGWRMRVELAKLLLAAPDVLLLDEPTNHLDLPSIQWFEETLAELPRRASSSSPTTAPSCAATRPRVAELDARTLHASSRAAGPLPAPSEALRREQLLARQRARRSARSRETERFIERFRYKASKARQVQSRIKALEKMERVELAPESARQMRLRVPPPARAGAVVLRLEGVHKRYGETRRLRGHRPR